MGGSRKTIQEGGIMNYSNEELQNILNRPGYRVDTTGLIPSPKPKIAKSGVLPAQRQGNGRSSKYNAIPAEYNGIRYPSKHEAQTAQDLDLQVKAGEIDFYLRQVNFPLPGCTYRADFVTFKAIRGIECPGWPNFIIKVVEAKGYPTQSWKMKQKLFKETYPNLELKVV